MKDLYKKAKEDINPNTPKPRGKSTQINVFVNEDHAVDKMRKKSQTGIILLMNQTPIIY